MLAFSVFIPNNFTTIDIIGHNRKTTAVEPSLSPFRVGAEESHLLPFSNHFIFATQLKKYPRQSVLSAQIRSIRVNPCPNGQAGLPDFSGGCVQFLFILLFPTSLFSSSRSAKSRIRDRSLEEAILSPFRAGAEELPISDCRLPIAD